MHNTAVDVPVSVTRPPVCESRQLDRDTPRAARYFAATADLLAGLPEPARRAPEQRRMAAEIHGHCRRLRADFLRTHADDVYRTLTDGLRQDQRLDHIAYGFAEFCPGLVPDREVVAVDRGRALPGKEGWEIDQGLLFSDLLGRRDCGEHLVTSMLTPTRRASQLRAQFARTGQVDLGAATVCRVGAAAHITVRNPGFLNAEDDVVVAALETAVDLALLDDDVAVAVLRGDAVTHPRYAGRRIFNAGINLTHLYQGKISFIDFLMCRELGYINKIFRGLHLGPDRPLVHKPWIGVVDTFAIGGGMQLLLVLDRVIAEAGAYLTLPALREGIIPGAANLRLSRQVGGRLARQLIFGGRRLEMTDPQVRLVCDTVVDTDQVDAVVNRAVEELANPAVGANRRVLHLAEEPPQQFREYMAAYAGEQCHRLFSADLVRNLERNWIGRRRDG
jgi:thioesterase DpgC